MGRSWLIILLAFAGAFSTFGQPIDQQVDSIRKIYAETNALVAEMQKAPDLSSVFVVELIVNKNLAPYPAVGIYQRTVKFFYTHGDREINPYPGVLIKVHLLNRRSARDQVSEYYFDRERRLIFVLITDPGADTKEKRLYFSIRGLIRMIEDGKDIDVRTGQASASAVEARKESTRLVGLFKSALAENN